MKRMTKPALVVLALMRFAALILSLLAVTLTLGTLIPQGEPVAFYIDKYGEHLTLLIKVFDLDCMYSSIWFRFLIVLIIVNLILYSWYRLRRINIK